VAFLFEVSMTIVVGIPGVQGPPGINWRSTWSSSTTYAAYDGVQYNGSSYIALQANQNVTPGTAPLQWDLVAQAALPSMVVQQVATFASLPATPLGLYLVLADETKGGTPTIYLFTASHRYWVAMIQDA
jgi:hypothetical protein